MSDIRLKFICEDLECDNNEKPVKQIDCFLTLQHFVVWDILFMQIM